MPFIEVLSDIAPEPGWEAAVHTFVTEILVSALAEKVVKFFRRRAFHYVGPNLGGEYWLPGFRLAPAIPNDDTPQMINAERVVYIDQNVEAIDDMHAHTLADEIARRHAARLSLVLNVGMYYPQPEQRWFLRIQSDPPKISSERSQLGFVDSSHTTSVMPEKGNECPLGDYGGSVLDSWRSAGLLTCPAETRRILRGVDNGEPRLREAFDRCARLWQVAGVAGRMFPSVGMAYEIAAVEAITSAYPEYGSFSGFVRQNVPAIEGLENFLAFLYGSVRSAHFHAGEFPLGEFLALRIDITDSDVLERTNMRASGYEIIRKSIMSWILRATESNSST